MKQFQVAILGLGLIGGSLAYALKGFHQAERIGYDIDDRVCAAALQNGAIDATAASPESAVAAANLVIFSSAPHSVLNNMRRCLPHLQPGCVITDICGVKQPIFGFLQDKLPAQISYVGLHPMAGKEVGGFENAEAALFAQAGFLVTPHQGATAASIDLINELAHYVGAQQIVENTPELHDEIIAYTSDLMHIAATALIKNRHPQMTLAHTAGAFRDCTRIANIDSTLWTELLLDNRQHILPTLQNYIDNLEEVKHALAANDPEALRSFLAAAAHNKRNL